MRSIDRHDVPAASTVKRDLAAVGLLIWLGVSLLVGGLLWVRHLVALPVPPATDTGLRDAIAFVLPAPTWRMVHVMYRSCPCSRRTIDHLVARRRVNDVVELVLIVDDDGARGADDRRLADAGFQVRVITPDALRTTFHLEAAPVLVVATPSGTLGYVGGYNRRKQSPIFEEVAILAEVQTREVSRPRPVFGCPTSARLADALDPLGLSKGTR